MKVFIDTNILIDVLASRADFYEASSNVVDLGITGEVELITTSMSFATAVFISKSVLGYVNAIKALQSLVEYITIVKMDEQQCHKALFSDMPDFEDMLQYEAAVSGGADENFLPIFLLFPEIVVSLQRIYYVIFYNGF